MGGEEAGAGAGGSGVGARVASGTLFGFSRAGGVLAGSAFSIRFGVGVGSTLLEDCFFFFVSAGDSSSSSVCFFFFAGVASSSSVTDFFDPDFFFFFGVGEGVAVFLPCDFFLVVPSDSDFSDCLAFDVVSSLGVS